MKKLILILALSSVVYAYKVDKIFFNDSENNKLLIFLYSNIQKDEELDLYEIDTLIENFNSSSTNKVLVDLEPSDKQGYTNIKITNEKKLPIKLKFKVSSDVIGVGTEFDGFTYSEKLSFFFTTNYKDTLKQYDLTFETPFKNNKINYVFMYRDYRNDIKGHATVYKLNNVLIRNKYEVITTLIRNKDYKILLNNTLVIDNTRNYLNRLKISKIDLYTYKVGLEYNKISKLSVKSELEANVLYPNIDFSINSNIKLFNKNKNIEIDTTIGKRSNLKLSFNHDLKNIYYKLGMVSDFNEVYPSLVVGLKYQYTNFNFDMNVNYEKSFKFNFSVDIN